MRKPSLKKSLSARTKGRATRAVKKALIPGYGKKGMGILHPKRALYNKVYRKTTFEIEQWSEKECPARLCTGRREAVFCRISATS